MEVTTSKQEMRNEIRQKTALPLLWVGMVSIVMFFAALTSAVIVSKGAGNWKPFELPDTFLFSTVFIVLSSVTYWFAFRSAKNNNKTSLKIGVMLTLILGLLFALFQFISWGNLVDQGIFFTGSESSVSGSYLYAISGLHLAHLFGGLISLLVVYVKSNRGMYNSENLLGLQLSTTYWHFVDVLWVYLFIFLNFIAL